MNASGWTEKHFTQLWKRFGEIYGRRFFEENGDTMPQTWRESIAQLTFDQVGKALDVCRTIGDQHPIILSQFMGRVRDQRRAPYHQRYKGLPKPEPDPEATQRRCGELRTKSRQIGDGGRRSVLLPGETWGSYAAAKAEANRAGIDGREFDRRRLEANGWDVQCEQEFERQVDHAMDQRGQRTA